MLDVLFLPASFSCTRLLTLRKAKGPSKRRGLAAHQGFMLLCCLYQLAIVPALLLSIQRLA